MTQEECIDEAVNILMDEILRPDLGISDAVDSDLDDKVYSYVHNLVKSIVVKANLQFQSARE